MDYYEYLGINTAVVKLLVKEGTDINCINAKGLTPLMLG